MEVEKGEIITLSDNKEYVCLSTVLSEDNKKYLYLMTTKEPINFCFAEEKKNNGLIEIRIIGSKNEKQVLFKRLKTQFQTNSNRENQNA